MSKNKGFRLDRILFPTGLKLPAPANNTSDIIEISKIVLAGFDRCQNGIGQNALGIFLL
jgi:hypothetical protein